MTTFQWGECPAAGAPYLFGAALMILCAILALLLDRSSEEGLQDETLYQGSTLATA